MSKFHAVSAVPSAQGLYHPSHEHDACGIGFVASVRGERSHDIILKGIEVLINLTHRGACGCDAETGDGAGILIQFLTDFLPANARRWLQIAGARRLRSRHGFFAGRKTQPPAM